MGAFGERLHDAMLAAGMSTVAQLSKAWRQPSARIRALLLTRKPRILERDRETLVAALKCDSAWLFTGAGSPMPRQKEPVTPPS